MRIVFKQLFSVILAFNLGMGLLNAQPNASFTYSFKNNDSCGDNVTVNFNNTSTGASEYRWYFDGRPNKAVIDTTKNPSFTYSYAREYFVVLEAMTPNDTSIATKLLDIDDKETAKIYPNPPSPVCKGSEVSFFSSGDVDYWVFNNSDTIRKPRPNRTFNSTGEYPVEVQISNNCNDDSEKDTIKVTNNAKPQVTRRNIFVRDNEICPGRTVSFSGNYTDKFDSLKWKFGDGISSNKEDPTHTYTSTDTFTAKLIAFNQCNSDTAKVDIKVNNQPKLGSSPFFMYGPDKLCKGDTGNFRIQTYSEVKDFKWDFGNGNYSTLKEPEYVFPDTGTYTVKLTGYGYCGDSVTETMQVKVSNNTKYSPGFTTRGPYKHCPGVKLQFDVYDFNGQDNAQFFWKFGDGGTATGGRPKHAYSQAGTYNVKLITTSGCGASDTSTDQVTVKNDYLMDNNGMEVKPEFAQCPGAPFEFDFFATTNLKKVEWFFGDGQSKTTNKDKVSHAYQSPGTYRVIARGYNYCGERGYASTTVEVNNDGKPEANIFIRTQDRCPGQMLDFDPNRTYDEYLWKFGDGDTSRQKIAHHAYDTGGTYTVQMIASNQCGKDTAKQELVIKKTSQPDFKANIACKGDTTEFSDLSQPTPDFWRWDFRNGKISNNQNPRVKFDTLGTYPVTLSVKKNGCRSSVTKEVKVTNQSPTAGFNYDTNGLKVSLTETANLADSFHWAFGDGSNSNEPNPNHNYSEDSTYQVCLTVFNGCGEDSTCTRIAVESAGTFIPENHQPKSLKIYPNPAEDKLQVRYEGQNGSVADIQILNARGQTIDISSQLEEDFNGSKTLNVNQLKPGTYFLNIRKQNGEMLSRKIIVQ